ncbi:hypothetical protein [Anabaena sp. UHCC 0204]|uniref:hypothetical protein n=1 Tax=Anabaena sp. UHCC 0204 TaxID=2590009 RepID=UPI00352E2592
MLPARSANAPTTPAGTSVTIAWQIAQADVSVILHEMHPQSFSPAYHTENLAELTSLALWQAIAPQITQKIG